MVAWWSQGWRTGLPAVGLIPMEQREIVRKRKVARGREIESCGKRLRERNIKEI